MQPLRCCKDCKRWKNLCNFYNYRKFQYGAWHIYTRKTCIRCFNVKNNNFKAKYKIKHSARRNLEDATFRAIVRFLKLYPELLEPIYTKNPIRFKQILKEEKVRIIKEHAKRSMTHGRASAERAQYVEEFLLEELEQGRL